MNGAESKPLSIVTVCLNAEDVLPRALNSIRNQTNKNFELIVIDGNSSDSTKDVVRQNEDIITKWISEPDKGIADAMNKGVELASGNYVLFLNADDFLFDKNSIDVVLKFITGDKDIYAFPVIFTSEMWERRVVPKLFSWNVRFKLPFCHQGVVCKRSLFSRLGGFDTSFKIVMDYDFFLRAYLAKATYRRGEEPIAIFSDGGVSSLADSESLRKRFKEERRCQQKNMAPTFWSKVIRFWWVFYRLYLNSKYPGLDL